MGTPDTLTQRNAQETYAAHRGAMKGYNFASMSFEVWLSWHLEDASTFGCKGCEFHTNQAGK